ncbi:MAG: TraB/GumN family protein [Bacteroidia bacterium]|nr:TraB/GumN family protein [Bacteroidia bacterium]
MIQPLFRSFLCSFLLLTFSTFLLPVAAQPDNLQIVDMHTGDIPVLPANALLWEITGPDIQKPSYIFGTLGLVPYNYFFLPEGLTPLWQACDKLVMEVNPADTKLDVLYRGAAPLDSTLDVLLPKREYEAVYTFIHDSLSADARYKMERRYPPMLLARQVICDYCLGYQDGKEPISYEYYLFETIRKPLKVLTTGWTRTAWMDDYSVKDQTHYLKDVLLRKDLLCDNFRRMYMAYRDEDLDRVSLLAREAPDFGDNFNQLIELRNQEWMKSLTWNMKYESLFIAVNAVQLPGEYGLLHQLRKAGFTVKAVGRP